MHTIANKMMITLSADSGNFQGFNILVKQSENTAQYDQWRQLTLEEAKKVELSLLISAYEKLFFVEANL
jgi:predicted ATPase